jgi:NADH-quinone oxidoreductase subunit L
MEGPTPVSALIHAATMVAAGVFLIARTWPLFELSPVARGVAVVLGTVTALGAATIAVTQTDIKKVLAYSTISQLGFMFAALGVGAWRVAIFHLVTHAAFKSLLFLGSGSVIHGSGTQDLRGMGGLWKRMPVTALTWMMGSLALAGIPVWSGFFSKDEIVASVLHAAPWAGVALLAASALTGAYIARATQLAFFGTYRGDVRPHESPPTMTVPLVALAVAASVLGLAGGGILATLGGEPEPIDVTVAVIAVALALAGAVAGALTWARDAGAETTMPTWLERAWSAARGGYGYDRLLQRLFVSPIVTFAVFAHAFVDRLVIDGAVEGSAQVAGRLGAWLVKLQDGDGQRYAALVAIGAIALVLVAFALRTVG